LDLIGRTMRAAVSQIVVLRCGDVFLGIPIDRVREIVLVPEIAPVPESGEVIRGIINLRGRILPVLDLGHRLGLSRAPRDRSGRIVVVEQDAEHLLGLLVDEASEVLRIPEGTLSPTPELAGSVLGAGVRNVARCDDRLILLVDLEVVFALDGSRPARREAGA
jgi:purine-binding chemotaxis protein CheW